MCTRCDFLNFDNFKLLFVLPNAFHRFCCKLKLLAILNSNRNNITVVKCQIISQQSAEIILKYIQLKLGFHGAILLCTMFIATSIAKYIFHVTIKDTCSLETDNALNNCTQI